VSKFQLQLGARQRDQKVSKRGNLKLIRVTGGKKRAHEGTHHYLIFTQTGELSLQGKKKLAASELFPAWELRRGEHSGKEQQKTISMEQEKIAQSGRGTASRERGAIPDPL